METCHFPLLGCSFGNNKTKFNFDPIDSSHNKSALYFRLKKQGTWTSKIWILFRVSPEYEPAILYRHSTSKSICLSKSKVTYWTIYNLLKDKSTLSKRAPNPTLKSFMSKMWNKIKVLEKWMVFILTG